MRNAPDDDALAAEVAALARSYVALWQEQMTTLAADPATVAAMTRLLQALAPGDSVHDATTAPSAAGPPGGGEPGGTVGPGQSALVALGQRIDRLEQRVARLEARLPDLPPNDPSPNDA